MTAGTTLRKLGAVVLFAVVFLAGALSGLLLHADLPPSRRLVANLVERALEKELRGRFVISGIERLSPWLVRIAKVEIFDPKGALVIRGEGLRARADTLGIVRQLLLHPRRPTLVVEHVRLERVEVRLLPDPRTGDPTLVDTFSLRTPPAPGGSEVRVWLPAIELGRGKLVGRLSFAPKLEADVHDARGAVLASPVGVAVDAPSFSAKIRGLLPSELRAVGSFHQRGTKHFWGTLDGYVGDIQYDSVVRLDGRHLEATVDLPHADPANVRELVRSWPVLSPVTLRATLKGDLPHLHAQVEGTIARSTVRATGDLDLSGEPKARFRVEGAALDARSFLTEAPETSIDLTLLLDIDRNAKGVVVRGDGETKASTVAGVPVPSSKFRGRYDPDGLEVSATLFEEGMPLEGKVSVGPGGTVDVQVHAEPFRLERAPRVQKLVGARGTLELSAEARVAEGKLSGSFSANGKELGLGGFRAGALRATGEV
jgi:hypothetical protein